jgi:hypothetical protein
MLWLGELMSYQAATDINVDTTYNYRYQAISQLVHMVNHYVTPVQCA